jgi:hypothetical protein
MAKRNAMRSRAATRGAAEQRATGSKRAGATRHATSSKRPRSASHAKGARRRWSHEVKTVSTFPPEGLYTKDAETIARVMATKKVSPKGIGSGIRMVQFFINRAGHTLPASRRRELEKAKRLLQQKAKAQRDRAA